ncbi:aldo/keto reductase [Kaistia dalseonensis]|uniref:Aryl-alcohol dehydrogenase-like predicted oxidoreductase n=1 Tax=Kaistia dalseonensis TaxID=410840 RepID=A0ABU0H331_9HYPH|nr:aldo/keto reductase [Kaistia dalseonensis]MCX5493324.1 aldo/keto reductase [Kaistia dalseonensis]MDQ0435881.1 aryl-alcohol dehydrogenase-like predicted oxidoreductase [Kaistia dalseonensis]
MEYRTLGTSGAVVSNYALGTMTFGAESDETTSHAVLDDYVAAGGNFIDTADVYSTGVSEEIIGRWLKAHPTERDQMVVATKGRFPMGPGPNDIGLSRRHLNQALDASLKRLGVEHIDLYQMHAWDALTPLEETLRFLDDSVSNGKIGYYGFSNFVGWHLTKAVHIAKAQGYAAPVTLQPQYSLLVRDIEVEIVPASLDAGIGLLPWSPLGGGWLTGKYKRDTSPSGATRLGENPDRGMEAFKPRNAQERTWLIIDAVDEIAKARGVSMAQVALAWVAAQPAVTSVILGARNQTQLADNLKAAKLVLTPQEIAHLSEVSAPAWADYPYGTGGRDQRHRKIEGGR